MNALDRELRSVDDRNYYGVPDARPHALKFQACRSYIGQTLDKPHLAESIYLYLYTAR